MDFSNPDLVLKILLSKNTDYLEILEIAQDLVQEIKFPHKNSVGNLFPSALSQCILECYKIKNNFTSSIWYNAKRLEPDMIKPNSIPTVFSRKIANGQYVDYELYNAEQIVGAENIEKNSETQNPETSEVKSQKVTPLKPEPTKQKMEKDNIKLAIMNFVSEFDGLYGRSGIAKVLKGSISIKDNDFNSPAKNSKYFGLIDNYTRKYVTSVVDELIEEGVLYFKKANFGRPLVCIKKDVKIKEFKFGDEIETGIDDENILKVINLINKGNNIFITGHAGTGKSYILNNLKQRYPKLVVTSTTGIAAVNVKGQTLHSWAGVGICNKPVEQTVDKILKKHSIKYQIKKCKILAIDEISMLDIKTFEYVDTVLRQVRGNDKPFGGIQVIFLGDFYQLPPVNENNNFEQQTRKYCFESPLWKDLDLQTIVLTKNYRQNEENLINALAHMRTNSMTTEDSQLLKSRECPETEELSNILHIFATNNEADSYNSLKFNSIKSHQYPLEAIDGIYKDKELITTPTNEREINMFRRIDMVCSADKTIYLKIGVRVMLLTNLDFEKGLINGSCGVVKEIENNGITVEFDNGETEKIEKHNFEFYNNDVLVAVRKQFPLRLAYGITIHKSQGMSLDKLVVDCSRIFEKGQLYVALSRIRTLNGLYLHNFNPQKVMVDEKVVDFYNQLTKF